MAVPQCRPSSDTIFPKGRQAGMERTVDRHLQYDDSDARRSAGCLARKHCPRRPRAFRICTGVRPAKLYGISCDCFHPKRGAGRLQEVYVQVWQKRFASMRAARAPLLGWRFSRAIRQLIGCAEGP